MKALAALVLASRHWLEVVEVDAATTTAEVVEFFALGQWPVLSLPEIAMSEAATDAPIASLVELPSPEVTAVESVDLDG